MKGEKRLKVKALAEKLKPFGLELQIPTETGDKNNEGTTSVPIKPVTEDSIMTEINKNVGDVGGMSAPEGTPADPLGELSRSVRVLTSEIVKANSLPQRAVNLALATTAVAVGTGIVVTVYHMATKPKAAAPTDLPAIKK